MRAERSKKRFRLNESQPPADLRPAFNLMMIAGFHGHISVVPFDFMSVRARIGAHPNLRPGIRTRAQIAVILRVLVRFGSTRSRVVNARAFQFPASPFGSHFNSFRQTHHLNIIFPILSSQRGRAFEPLADVHRRPSSPAAGLPLKRPWFAVGFRACLGSRIGKWHVKQRRPPGWRPPRAKRGAQVARQPR